MDQQTEMGGRGSLGERTRDLTAQAQQKAEGELRTGVDSGKRKAADALHGFADSLLNGSGEAAEGASKYVRQAGERVQRAADWLEHADLEELSNKTEDFARRQPALFIGGAFALGLVAARVLKASRSSSRDESSAMTGTTRSNTPMAGVPMAGVPMAGVPMADAPARDSDDSDDSDDSWPEVDRA